MERLVDDQACRQRWVAEMKLRERGTDPDHSAARFRGQRRPAQLAHGLPAPVEEDEGLAEWLIAHCKQDESDAGKAQEDNSAVPPDNES
jgi:hypothetical protein